ncbi:MAG: oxalate/formate MFS antiporter [Pseudomonadota bacterium]|nr:oxalate/formate MFS antiporter [Pseudomonadota bacterium]
MSRDSRSPATQCSASPPPSNQRWQQLLLALICMLAISSPQYVWTLFTRPLAARLGADLPALQVTFSLLIVVQTFLSPLQAWLIERLGPRRLLSIGGVLTGLSWVLTAQAGSLTGLYLSYGILGGLGTGTIYVGVIGLMTRWFPDRRGFAAGIAAAGYGMGAIATTFPIAASLSSRGLDDTLLWFGVGIGAVAVAAAQGIRAPTGNGLDRTASASGRDFTPREMLRTPVFWLMFLMMTLMSTSGLMVISQMATFTRDFGVASYQVFGLAALPLALTLDRVTNGLTRPFFGWLSDRIGRERTMALAFGFEGVAMILWLLSTQNPTLFVLLSGVVFFGWGEIFSLFPATLSDTFGDAHGTLNYGFLYMAQGIGAIFGGPLAALLHQRSGSWLPVFAVVIACDLLTAVLAALALRPLRERLLVARPPVADSFTNGQTLTA